MTSPKRYFKEVAHQAKKVRWPSWSNFSSKFLVVLIVIILACLILMFENWTAGVLVSSLTNAFK